MLFNTTAGKDCAILSRATYSGDVSCVAVVHEHRILVDGYQSFPQLFMVSSDARIDDVLAASSFASVHVGSVAYKIYSSIATSTWYTMSGVLAADDAVETIQGAGSPRLSSGALRLVRQGNTLTAAIRINGDMAAGWQPVGNVSGVATGPIKAGIRIDKNYNPRYYIDLANLHCEGDSQIYPNHPPSPPEPQRPPPHQPPPPSPAPPPCIGPASRIRNQSWVPMGVGGGGAQSSFSMSPLSNLWFVGTDMGMLYRSEDRGATWAAVSHLEARYSVNLQVSPPIGFSGSNPQVALHAPCFLTISLHQPCAVLRSEDGGHTWSPVNVTAPSGAEGRSYGAPDVPNNRKYIRMWAASFSQPGLMFAATEDGVRRSVDDGVTWDRVQHALLEGDSVGIYVDDEPTGEFVLAA